MSVPSHRGAHGHFLPGQSANPGGRSGSLTAVREKLKTHIDVYVAELVKLMGDADPGTRLAALREYGDRLMGKPTQQIETDARLMTFDVGAAFVKAHEMINEGRKAAVESAVDVTPPTPRGARGESDDGDGRW
jgi:hypothetical protein